jgi:hypothetical protein
MHSRGPAAICGEIRDDFWHLDPFDSTDDTCQYFPDVFSFLLSSPLIFFFFFWSFGDQTQCFVQCVELHTPNSLLNLFFFETVFCHVALAGLKLSILSLLSAGIIGMYHHTWLLLRSLLGHPSCAVLDWNTAGLYSHLHFYPSSLKEDLTPPGTQFENF